MSALDRLSWLSGYGDVWEHEPLARHTTMRIGGPARWFVRVRDRERLLELLPRLERDRVPWFVLGGGSNTLVGDTGIDAVILQPQLLEMSLDESGVVHAAAGCISALFARKVTEAGFTGWEWGIGLPGTIGGAIVGNAGCYGGETADRIEEVEAWSKRTGSLERYTRTSAEFGYRRSRFKQEPHVILSGTWRLRRSSEPEASYRRLQTILQERKTHQPLGKASAGCLFTNTAASIEQIERLEAQLGERVPEASRQRGQIPTGWLLDRLGYKGTRSGTMRLSDVHANFLLPDEQGSSHDVLRLRDQIQGEVFAHTGIRLETEVRLLGDDESVLH